MDSHRVQATTPKFSDLVDACRHFVRCHTALLERDEETRHDIVELINYINSGEADDSEIDSVLATIAQTLFPKLASSAVEEAEEKEVSQEMDREEATFAECLEHAMQRKGVTQVELATSTGVGQPAISMMLSRACRPQKRTVEKFARALGVSVEELWPPLAASMDSGGISHCEAAVPNLIDSGVPARAFSPGRRRTTWTEPALRARFEDGAPEPPLRGAA